MIWTDKDLDKAIEAIRPRVINWTMGDSAEPKCKERHYINAAAGTLLGDTIGGMEVVFATPSEATYVPPHHMYVETLSGQSVVVSTQDIKSVTDHTWADTGMRKTWCTRCDADGEYDPMTGETTEQR